MNLKNVVKCFEKNGYDDSDFYAVVYDESSDKFRGVEIGSTRYPGGATNLEITASLEIQEKYHSWVLERRSHWDLAIDLSIEAGEIKKGNIIEIVKGRKISKGLRFEVLGIYRSFYGKNNYNIKIQYNGIFQYVDIANVAKIVIKNGKEYLAGKKEIEYFHTLPRYYTDYDNT